MAIEGILNVDKPKGPSSARVVAQIKRQFPRGTKVGHAGTLDPFATGVLVVLVGKATRLCESFMGQPKQYEAAVKLGATTATLDPDSPEVVTADAQPVERERVGHVLLRFIGEIEQAPPAFSALKVGGRRAYELARAGKAVELAKRLVRVDGIEVIDYQWPVLTVRVDCGRGTYIRSLARDIGDALGVGGYLQALRRTRVGECWAADAVALERLLSDGAATHLRGA